jgi:hypothetical protein
MVPPGLGPKESEEAWGQAEHGDTAVEHLVDGINEPLRLGVHDLLQHPQTLSKYDVSDGWKGG